MSVRRLAAAALLLAIAFLPAPPRAAAEDGLPDRAPRIPRLPSKEKRELEELFERWFDADDAERRKIEARVTEIDPIAPSNVKELRKLLFRLARDGLRTDGSSERKLDHPDYPGTFHIHGARRGRKRGLLIGLHGGGQGVGDGRTSAQKWQAAQGKKLIVVFPTAIDKVTTAWNKPEGERYVLELIETIKRSYPIDTNRVYLVGHSMGGFGTWHIGGRHADLFAAISPNAGGIFGMRTAGGDVTGLAPGILPNLHNTPVYFTHGADDRQVGVGADRLAAKLLAKLEEEHPDGYEHVYEEYPDIGHGLPPKGTMPIIDWLVEHERDPYPEKVVWETPRDAPWKRSFYWLRRPASAAGVLAVAEWTDENRLAMKLPGDGAGWTVLLSEEMVDFDEPVTVTVNGTERFRHYVPPSALALLLSIGGRNDPEMFFTARIDL